MYRDEDHIVFNTLAGTLECRNCGEVYEFNKMLPAPIDDVLAFVDSWKKPHIGCELSDGGRKLRRRRKEEHEAWKKEKEDANNTNIHRKDGESDGFRGE
jgi:hypothetical protein